jgi:hypothetical protein
LAFSEAIKGVCNYNLLICRKRLLLLLLLGKEAKFDTFMNYNEDNFAI